MSGDLEGQPETETSYLPDPDDEYSGTGSGFVWFAVIVLLFVGGVGGYLWNQQGWWPAQSGLTSAERIWCEYNKALVLITADGLGYIPESLQLEQVIEQLPGEEPITLRMVLVEISRNLISPAPPRDPGPPLNQIDFALYSNAVGALSFIDLGGWGDHRIIESCAAAYEAFR